MNLHPREVIKFCRKGCCTKLLLYLDLSCKIFRELNNNTTLKGADCMDMWGFIQTPMLGRKSGQNYQGYVAREKPVKHQSCKSFPPAKKVICHAMSHYYMLPFLFSALGQGCTWSSVHRAGFERSFKPQALSRSPSLWYNIYISQHSPDLAPEKARGLLEDPREWLEKSLIFFVHAMAFLRLTNMKSALFE